MWDVEIFRKSIELGERMLANLGDSERHAATLWDLRNSERQPATIGVSKRHVAMPWDLRDSETQ